MAIDRDEQKLIFFLIILKRNSGKNEEKSGLRHTEAHVDRTGKKFQELQ